ncbi:hypothetical protein HU200_052830 [Digitaria exilis]|uniref:Uncharacterized protein n=1 Tax=Digitaria exilis TaxID=1010633 RepID=A0A835ANB1_9POAL|nr:hypothetical protein HU200_052830 [Digitaria exilis]CAB3466157.1 unnamed protein product [Digitaria exilis]
MASAAASMLSAAGRRLSRSSLSASTILWREVRGQHKLTIDGCVPSTKIPKDWSATSRTFEAGGYDWQIKYEPYGYGNSWSDKYISVELVYGGKKHTDPLHFTFSLLDNAGKPVPRYSRSSPEVCYFDDGYNHKQGFQDFIRWKDLEESGCLKDDRFAIQCDITVIKDWSLLNTGDDDVNGDDVTSPASVVLVPLPDLHQHLGYLLRKKQATDVTIDVGGEMTYDVHGWLLAARSPAFEAELVAATKAKSGGRRRVEIKGIEPVVFEAMLRFVYTDELPEMAEEGDAVEMAKGLVAAAHRFELERLKMMCEEMLCGRIDVNNVAGILVVAEECGCRELKEACVEFIAAPGNLKAVMETEGYEKMKAKCPTVLVGLKPRRGLLALIRKLARSTKMPRTLPPGRPVNQCSEAVGIFVLRLRPAMATSAAMLSAAARRVSRSASTIITREVTGHHNLTISGFTPSRKMPTDWTASSQAFEAAGHGWRITYYPNGNSWSEHVSLYLEPVHGDGRQKVSDTDPVEFAFTLLDPSGNPVPHLASASSKGVTYFDGDSMTKGFQKFISWSDLESSGCLKDDSFTVRCDITVIKNWTETNTNTNNNSGNGAAVAGAAPAAAPPRVVVPPSDLHKDLMNLLWKKQGADVVMEVGGETYEAHGWLLAARSPAFEAELLAAAKEKVAGGVVRRRMEVQGVEPKVFEAMLRFVYTDALPAEVAEEEGRDAAVAMAQGLLAAAQRFKLGRLKTMCEEMLCQRIDMDTVADTLVVAEQHGCRGLLAACVEFLARPGNLKKVMETQGYEKMKASCHSVVLELFLKQLAARG